ncbi:hypothetical protein [Massilia sp. 9096]|uniref:hypothetical protein n=1 Tax=Massilia sp. 9096 TaxID=1500894 RepID=UPI0012E03F9D|nr:hypothetical protein [Massilia sp. 9096]
MMNLSIEKVTKYLTEKKIPEDAYAFYSDREDAFCIDKVGEEWLIYYVERGKRIELAWGKTESQALDVLRLYLLHEFKMN